MKKTNSKIMQNAIYWHNRSNDTDLDDVYGNYSTAKYNAYEYCINLFRELNGWDFKIISHNTFSFSVGFYFISKETGAICFAYITKDYDRYTDKAEFFPDNLYVPSYISVFANK